MPMKLMLTLINRISSHNAVRSGGAGFLWSLNTFQMSEYIKKTFFTIIIHLSVFVYTSAEEISVRFEKM